MEFKDLETLTKDLEKLYDNINDMKDLYELKGRVDVTLIYLQNATYPDIAVVRMMLGDLSTLKED